MAGETAGQTWIYNLLLLQFESPPCFGPVFGPMVDMGAGLGGGVFVAVNTGR